VNDEETRRAAPALDTADWKAVSKRLFAYALRRHRLSPEDAEQIAQEAIRRFFDPAYSRYAPEAHGDVLRFLGSVVNGIVVNQRRRRHERPASTFALDALIDSAPSPEDRAADAEHARAIVAVLMNRTQDDRIARRVLEIMSQGISKPAEQAAELAVPIAEVYLARRRLKSHLAAVTSPTGT
jgi:DNA-directed RNA polymerase specialized sigma24 family protein